MQYTEFVDGLVICGTFPEPEVAQAIERAAGNLPLVVADPPYGNIVNDEWDKVGSDDDAFARWMIGWTAQIERLSLPGAALYVWGGIGKPCFRPFYRYLVEAELRTGYKLANHITWAKKRAYGVQHNYLFTREEVAYFVLGEDIKKPRCFHVPLLDTKRGYSGYNEKYPAKSEYLRRTNVWSDVTEVLRGKTHVNQKPVRLMQIPIEVHTDLGEWVLDPFAGSGSTALAARASGRKFVLVEQDPAEYAKICQTLQAPSTQAEDDL